MSLYVEKNAEYSSSSRVVFHSSWLELTEYANICAFVTDLLLMCGECIIDFMSNIRPWYICLLVVWKLYMCDSGAVNRLWWELGTRLQSRTEYSKTNQFWAHMRIWPHKSNIVSRIFVISLTRSEFSLFYRHVRRKITDKINNRVIWFNSTQKYVLKIHAR